MNLSKMFDILNHKPSASCETTYAYTCFHPCLTTEAEHSIFFHALDNLNLLRKSFIL